VGSEEVEETRTIDISMNQNFPSDQKILDKEPKEAHKNNLKEDILQVLNDNCIEMILDRINQNVQETLKNLKKQKKK
jgi:hypothetical protein